MLGPMEPQIRSAQGRLVEFSRDGTLPLLYKGADAVCRYPEGFRKVKTIQKPPLCKGGSRVSGWGIVLLLLTEFFFYIFACFPFKINDLIAKIRYLTVTVYSMFGICLRERIRTHVAAFCHHIRDMRICGVN